ncbi:hypothetical protein VTN77DRAFT_6678 [Rasamsonia byssochlamydoides]|uniref:uncharacterized protein n=1 Tax=Rasamsonia byssochlamydoides TaxID=89139 RepID=UPI003743043B
MRSSRVTPALSILALLAAQPQPVQSNPFPLEYDNILVDRACANPCGYYSQLCCTSTQTCGTNSAGQAVCLDGESNSGTWEYYTTTYTATDLVTITSVWSSWVTPTPTSGASTCQLSLGESICGSSCCSAAEICDNGVCVAGSSSAVAVPTATPPLRPTSSGVATVTETSAPTTTVPFIAPVGTNGATIVAKASSGGGLSGGAIAGIVIGTIAGVFLLLALCFCFCLRGALDGLLALLGLGPRRRKETTYVEERYSHHSSERPERRTWFGTRPSRPEGSEGGKSSGLGFWGTLALILGAIALCLGLRRRENRDEKSDYYTNTGSYSYYSYDDSYYNYTSASSESSDRRTRRTRDTRTTRSSRRTRSRR